MRMLSRVGAVTPTLRGLSPDLADKDWLEREEAWCRQRKPITPKAYTEEERERLRQAGLRLKKRATVPAQKMSDVERDSQVMSEGRDATSRHERAL